MYQEFFEFSEPPFELTPNPRHMVYTATHREALSNLEYAIAGGKGLTLLVGDAGVGKTTVIRAAIQKQSERTHCIHVNNPALTRGEFVELLALQFGLSDRAKESKAVFLRELETHLRERRAAQERTVLIVDEAQRLSRALLEEVRLLANMETDDEKLLTLIIVGQPEVALRLNRRSLQQLKQRVALRCELRPLTERESVAYIAGRIQSAGGTPSNVFTREAVGLIAECSRGLPRTINVIADNALLGGFAAEQRPVTREIVRQVCLDFDIEMEAGPSVASRLEPLPRVARPLRGKEAARPAPPAPADDAAEQDEHAPDMDHEGATLAQRTVGGLSARLRRLASF